MTVILSASSSRADIGSLAPLWQALMREEDCALSILLTGMHCLDSSFGLAAVPDSAHVHIAGADIGGETAELAANAMAEITRASSEFIAASSPDIAILIGDRLDMIPIALALLPFNIPFAHIHGGEITEGAIDDRVRHALTKMANLHFVANESAGARVRSMGEEAWRIYVTGAPGLDTLKATERIDKGEFAKAVGISNVDRLRLVTVHPETNSPNPLAPIEAVLEALDKGETPTLFTAPNSDPGGVESHDKIDQFVASRPWAHFRHTLGPLYCNALRHASVMVGNSSSGLIEAGLFGLPVVNVGDRQAGRERGDNVIDVAADKNLIGEAISTAMSRSRSDHGMTPYGDGEAAPRIVAALRNLPEPEVLLRKRWSDSSQTGKLHSVGS
jgi:UDP-hydrolysing UDP-N-acetyl-D-glucosamine 2-epimerase